MNDSTKSRPNAPVGPVAPQPQGGYASSPPRSLPWDAYVMACFCVGGGLVILCRGIACISRATDLPWGLQQVLTLWGTVAPMRPLGVGVWWVARGVAMLLAGRGLHRGARHGWWVGFISHISALCEYVCLRGSWDWPAIVITGMILWFIVRAGVYRPFSSRATSGEPRVGL
jgi:lysylphosphatidylglycerol synthetase-like protein (DUF2156 family)